MDVFTHLKSYELLSELDDVDQAIGRSSTFERFRDEAGRIRVRVTTELLTLVEREHLVVSNYVGGAAPPSRCRRDEPRQLNRLRLRVLPWFFSPSS